MQLETVFSPSSHASYDVVKCFLEKEYARRQRLMANAPVHPRPEALREIEKAMNALHTMEFRHQEDHAMITDAAYLPVETPRLTSYV